MQEIESKFVESYDLTLQAMSPSDIEQLHALSISVQWPHRAEDWSFLLQHGQGITAKDEISRLIASAMWLPNAPDSGNICMVITSPRLQTQGAAHWLMERVFSEMGNRNKTLIATRQAYRLYIAMGFQTVCLVYQHNGIVTSAPASPDHARRMNADDFAAIVALDQAATGLDRSELLKHILQLGHGTVVTQDSVVTGFAFCRPFGRGHVIGPVVALDQQDAIALIAPITLAYEGRFLRLDTSHEGALRDYLIACGMIHHDTVTKMKLGDLPHPQGPQKAFAIVSQAVG
jgi:hypothetical protein